MRPLPSICVAAAALSLLLAGCGGGEPNVEPAVAEDLAGQADRVAEALAQGDGCLALERTSQLQSATAGARDDGAVSDSVAAEILTATQRITEGTSCEPPAPEEDEPRRTDEVEDRDDGDDDRDDDDEDEDEDEDERGRGRGRGNGKGNGNGGGGDD